jgi:ectoine hydroxylase
MPAMKLTAAEIAEFRETGLLFLPSRFSPEDVALMTGELPGIFAQDRPGIIREKSSNAPRSAYHVHIDNPVFALVARHPRLVEPGMQLLGSDRLYLHQFKINAKAAFDGAVWQWHQDFAHWHVEDEMPEPLAMNIALFLAEANEFNGPLMFIPGSHRQGRLPAQHDTTTTSYPLWTPDHETVARLADENGIVAPKGPAGSVLMFHSNIVHASGSNLSPWSRTILYITLNRCDNAIRSFRRPDWVANKDFTPLEILPDDCLTHYARAHRSAAE